MKREKATRRGFLKKKEREKRRKKKKKRNPKKERSGRNNRRPVNGENARENVVGSARLKLKERGETAAKPSYRCLVRRSKIALRRLIKHDVALIVSSLPPSLLPQHDLGAVFFAWWVSSGTCGGCVVVCGRGWIWQWSVYGWMWRMVQEAGRHREPASREDQPGGLDRLNWRG